MQIYTQRSQLTALTKDQLADIIIKQANVLAIPEVAVFLEDGAVRNKIRRLANCTVFPGCIKVE
ncbi:hypothetical protein GCM10028806_33890 [Spirosoma terrae]|uniref:Uncharacterized protein n=1 Tax=Spirosoma terrae TaxID=1968276 RepID=A0A6L9L5N0_9BACT|nr:hypothetical protein [Spirosoma terrae]NDU95700.1 hypothetical protein [Spirosoma terrae]